MQDATGNVYGRLCVIGHVESEPGMVLCQCECGNQKLFSLIDIKRGKSRSCGCLRQATRSGVRDIAGKRFGALIALHRASYPGYRGPEPWKVQCDCGKVTIMKISRLNHAQHCGCLLHKLDTSPFGLFFCIQRNLARCLAHARVHGIEFDHALLRSHDDFLVRMPSPEYAHSVLERIDETKPYHANNLHWVVYAMPKKVPKMHQYRGIEMSTRHWAEHFNVCRDYMNRRIKAMPARDAFDPTVRRRSHIARRGRGVIVG